MRKMFSVSIAVAIFGALAVSPLWAKPHFRLGHQYTLNGVQLGPGSYGLNLNGDNEVEITRGRRVLVKARAEVLPLGQELPNSTRSVSGELKEIRLKSKRVVFLDSSGDN